MSESKKKHSTRNKKRRGCLFSFIILILAVVAGFSAYAWLANPLNLIPERETANSGGSAAADADMLYILVIGSDANEVVMDTSRADTIIVAMVDLSEKHVFLLSLPRDTYVPIEGHDHDKINHAYAYGGEELLQQTVSEFLDIPVDYYVLADFAGFEAVVDALGGVEIDVDKKMYYQTYDTLIDIEAGLQVLDGEQALQYVRYRADPLGDITRVSRQQNLLKAIFAQFTEKTGYSKLPQVLFAVNSAVETDLSFSQTVRLALFAKSLDSASVESATLAGDFISINGISYWQADEAAMRDLIASRGGGGD